MGLTMYVLCLAVAVLTPAICQGFLLDDPKPTDQHGLVLYLDATVTQLSNLTKRLQEDIQKKNDLTQFLQADVKRLNTTLDQVNHDKIALEARVTKLEKDLANSIATSGELTADLRSTKTLTRTLQSQLQSTNQTLNTIQTGQQQVNVSLLHQLGSLTTNLAAISHNVTSLTTAQSHSHAGASVSFTYRNPDPTIPHVETHSLKFHSPVTDNGGGYSVSTGVFTAPVAGTYWFGLTLGAAADTYINCYIVRNGHEYLAEVFASSFTDQSSVSSHALTHLKSGETATVLGCHGAGTLNKYRTSFSGMLINAD